MARPREFDRDAALVAAIGVFSEHGYEGSSTEALLKAMGIGRQSLYGTFGDKWQLYLAAVQRYISDSVGDQLRVLHTAHSPMEGLRAHLDAAVEAAILSPSSACLGVSAICEFGCTYSDLTMMSDMASRTLISALERRLGEAKADGAVAPEVDVREAANFIKTTLVGIKVAARAGASAESLRGIVRMALRSFL
jgi:TetR/AcrR family transcriptional repressor of nem operon